MAEPFRMAREAAEIAEAYDEDTRGRNKLRRAPHPQAPRLPIDWNAPKPEPAISWNIRRFIEAAKQSPTLASIYRETYAAVDEEINAKLTAVVKEVVAQEVAPLRAQIARARDALRRAQALMEEAQRILAGDTGGDASGVLLPPVDETRPLDAEPAPENPDRPDVAKPVPGTTAMPGTIKARVYSWMAQKGKFTARELKEAMIAEYGPDWGGKNARAYASALISAAQKEGVVNELTHRRPRIYVWTGPKVDPITGSMHRG